MTSCFLGCCWCLSDYALLLYFCFNFLPDSNCLAIGQNSIISQPMRATHIDRVKKTSYIIFCYRYGSLLHGSHMHLVCVEVFLQRDVNSTKMSKCHFPESQRHFHSSALSFRLLLQLIPPFHICIYCFKINFMTILYRHTHAVYRRTLPSQSTVQFSFGT